MSLANGLSAALWAQSEAINGTIRGRVADPTGAVIPQATVTVVNDATAYLQTVTTADDGYYVIPDLPLGTYTVTIQKAGPDCAAFKRSPDGGR